MSKITQEKILQTAGSLFASEGMVSISIRSIAKELHISPSLIYYYFKNEDELLLSMFHYLNRQLGKKRAALPPADTAKNMLKQRIEFQFDNQAAIVAVLKYYLKFRKQFKRFQNGFLPDKSSLHIEEVFLYGNKTGEFHVKNIEDDAKVITHAINGYLLEYYPHKLSSKEKNMLVNKIYSFIIRAL